MTQMLEKFLVRIGLLQPDAVYYIGGTDVLPPPLKGDEEQSTLEAMENGDENAKQRLIEHNLRLVVFIARRFENTGINIEDLISIGTIGLIKAIDSFNPSNGARFATYAGKCLQNEILMHFRAKKKNRCEVSMHETIDVDKDGNPLTYMDIICSDESVSDEVFTRVAGKKAYAFVENCLSERERYIITRRYGLDNKKPMTQRELAEEMGISRSYVSRIEKSALGKLYDALNLPTES